MTNIQREAAGQVAQLLRDARESAHLTQAELAHRAGISRAAVSGYESARRPPSLDAVDRVLSALGLQLRMETETLGSDLDAAIDAVSSIPLADRLGRETLLLALIDKLVSVPFVIEGSVAAVAQGAPLPVGALEIAVARDGLQALHTVLERLAALRWVTRLRIYGYAPVDPRLPGPLRWRTHLGDIALRIVDELPSAVRIGVGQRVLVVRPITELEAADQATRRILARVRQRMAAA